MRDAIKLFVVKRGGKTSKIETTVELKNVVVNITAANAKLSNRKHSDQRFFWLLTGSTRCNK
jgi:hypothetical protein